MRITPIPSGLAAEIRKAIYTHPAGDLSTIVQQSMDVRGQLPLAVKYVEVKWAKSYLKAAAKLKISTSLGYTWGTGTYVAPSAYPISTAIYGRAGIVAAFDPKGWQIFDATNPVSQALYLDWMRFQPLYRILTLTMHSNLANQFLRDLFRTSYGIDCVLFHPDQRNPRYTGATDVWMNVSDWTPTGELDTTFSSRFTDPWLVVLAEEEFESTMNDVGRQELIGPLSGRPANAALQAQIAKG